VPGTVAVRGGSHVSTRYYSDDGWTNQRVIRGTGLCQYEDEKRIAKEKEAAELEAKRKSQECLNIEEKSIPQASILRRHFDDDCDDDYQKRFDFKSTTNFGCALSIYDENSKIRECYMIRPSAITPDLPIPDSLIMEDEHLDTIPVTESANTIKSSVEDLAPIPSESRIYPWK
ncbi:hypothetical protein Tco_0675518, partial [Tanacetum coccineum]